MLREGDSIPEADVWTAPNERGSIADVVAGGRALLLFYLFDWSST